MRFRHAFHCSCFKQVPCHPDACSAWNWNNSGRSVRLPPKKGHPRNGVALVYVPEENNVNGW
ncbi:hypothetical protein CXT96_11155 [Akkermansia muciniphila]|nr:hypothetical protein CXT92_11865 [Akkermansia muciniphila]PNC89186.1 hypothetical protein CXT91_11805 [Akkermansia muciniphila]PND12495.1 hypothetical protein CXT96_11155 [Akkermansia muciniphila]